MTLEYVAAACELHYWADPHYIGQMSIPHEVVQAKKKPRKLITKVDLRGFRKSG